MPTTSVIGGVGPRRRNTAVSRATPRLIRRVIVVGASARAVAESASQAGCEVHAADLFTDIDLARAAKSVRRVRGCGPTGYPTGLPAAISDLPIAPCIFTGGLENHPDVLAAIARQRPLAGSPLAAISAVRDPLQLARLVRGVGLMFPPTVREPATLPTDGSWLVKPLASAGGRGIEKWRGRRPPDAAGVVWQRWVPGVPHGVSYLVGPQGSRLLGIARQLTGARWCRARGFAYCGSVASPLDAMRPAVRRQCERLGHMLAFEAGLLGLVGVDVVIDSRSRLHVIEVNPRPTASLELFEREAGESLVAAHLAVSGFPVPAASRPHMPPGRPGHWSKAIVFGPGRRLIAPPAAAVERLTAEWSAADGLPAVRDIPVARTRLPPRGPLVTVFARADSVEASVALLRRRVTDIRRLFDRCVSPPGGVERRPVRPRARTASGTRLRSSPDRSP